MAQAQTQRNIVQQRLSQAQTQRAGLVEKKFSPMHKQYRGTQIMAEREQVKERAKQREYLSGYEHKAKEHLGEISEYETEAEGYIGELGEHEAKIKGYEKEGYTPEKTDEGYTFSKTEMVRQKVRHEVSSIPEVSQKLIWDKPTIQNGKIVGWNRRTTQVSNINLDKALEQIAGYEGRVVSITSMADPGSKHYKYTYEWKPVTTTTNVEPAPVFSLGPVKETDYKIPEMDSSMKKTMDARALWAGGAITGGTATTEFSVSQPGFEQKMQKYKESQPGYEPDPYKKMYYVGKTEEGEIIRAPFASTKTHVTDPDWKIVETKISKGISDIDANLPMLKYQLEMLKGVPSGTEFEFDMNQDNIIQADEKMTAGELIPVVEGYISDTEKSRQELLKSRSILGKYKELRYEVNIGDDELSLIVPGEKGSVEYEREADIQRVMESGTPVQRVASMAKFWVGGWTSKDFLYSKSIGEALLGEEKGKTERLFETRVRSQVVLSRAARSSGIPGVFKELYRPGSPAFAITAAAVGGKAFGLGMGGIAGISPTLGTVASVGTGGYFMYRAGTELASLAISGYGAQWGGALGLAPAGLATTTAKGETIDPASAGDRFSAITTMAVAAPFAMRAFGSGFRTGHKYGSGVKSFISKSFPTINYSGLKTSFTSGYTKVKSIFPEYKTVKPTSHSAMSYFKKTGGKIEPLPKFIGKQSLGVTGSDTIYLKRFLPRTKTGSYIRSRGKLAHKLFPEMKYYIPTRGEVFRHEWVHYNTFKKGLVVGEADVSIMASKITGFKVPSFASRFFSIPSKIKMSTQSFVNTNLMAKISNLRGLKPPSERSLRFWDKYYSAKTKTSDALYKFGIERNLISRRPTRSVGHDWDIHTDPRMTGEYDVALMHSRGIGADRFMSYKGKSYFPSYDSWGFHSEGLMFEMPIGRSRMFPYGEQQFMAKRPWYSKPIKSYTDTETVEFITKSGKRGFISVAKDGSFRTVGRIDYLKGGKTNEMLSMVRGKTTYRHEYWRTDKSGLTRTRHISNEEKLFYGISKTKEIPITDPKLSGDWIGTKATGSYKVGNIPKTTALVEYNPNKIWHSGGRVLGETYFTKSVSISKSIEGGPTQVSVPIGKGKHGNVIWGGKTVDKPKMDFSLSLSKSKSGLGRDVSITLYPKVPKESLSLLGDTGTSTLQAPSDILHMPGGIGGTTLQMPSSKLIGFSTTYPGLKSSHVSLAQLEAMESGIGTVHSHWKTSTPSIITSKPSIKGVSISNLLGKGTISGTALSTSLMQESLLSTSLMQESLLSTSLISQQKQTQTLKTSLLQESLLSTSLMQESLLSTSLMQESLLSTSLISQQKQHLIQVPAYKTPPILVPRAAPVLDIFPKPRVDRPHAKPFIPFIPFLDEEEERPRKTKKRKPKKRKRGYRERKHSIKMYDIFGGM